MTSVFHRGKEGVGDGRGGGRGGEGRGGLVEVDSLICPLKGYISFKKFF